MSIGILIPEFPSQTHSFFWREIVALRTAGANIELLSTRRPPDNACRHDFAPAAREETHYLYPPRWLRAAGALLRRPSAALRAVRYVRGLERTTLRNRLRHLGLMLCAADLLDFARERGVEHVHAHSCADAAHVAAICHVLGGPSYSLTLHGDLSVYGRDHASKMAAATFVFCDGPHLVDQIVRGAGVPPARVASNWMGVDTARFTDGGRARRSSDGRLRVVTVARLDECKGHRFALEAIRAVLDQGVDIDYTLVGEGSHRAVIEAEIERLGLADRVTLLGTRGERDVLDILQTADAFVLPSVGLGEACGVAAMEAMSCGLPVVCSRIGAMPVVVDDGSAGMLVNQADVAELTTAFIVLATNPALRHQLGARARSRAVAEFDVHATAGRLLRAIMARPMLNTK